MIAAALAVAATLAWTPADAARLKTDLDLFAADPVVRGAHVGVLVSDAASGTVLYERAADDAFQPASTRKLIDGSALLERLGPTAHLHTTITWSPPILTFHAGGEPLELADLDAAAAALVQAGVRDVWRIDVDESRYDGERIGAGWSWDDLGEDFAARISPAILADNAISLRVAPGARPGDPAVLLAHDDAVPVVHMRAQTAAAGAPDTLDVTREGESLTVTGQIALGALPEDLAAAVPDAAEYVRARLGAALRRAGAQVRGQALILHAGPGAELPGRIVWSHDSAPLATLIADCWLPSDNLLAEMLLREFAIASGAAPGSAAAGIEAERAWLSAAAIPTPGYDVVDGSGLSPYDRLAPRTLVGVLVHDWSGALHDQVLAALPVAGASGTLADMYRDPPLAGHVFAKTGSLRHVRTLAGYLRPLCKDTVAFTVMVDEFTGDPAALTAWRGRLLERIANTSCSASV